jgi:hypothetical protein
LTLVLVHTESPLQCLPFLNVWKCTYTYPFACMALFLIKEITLSCVLHVIGILFFAVIEEFTCSL